MDEVKPVEEQSPSGVESLSEHLSKYADTFLRLNMVNATEKATTLTTAGLMVMFSISLLLFTLLFAGFGLAWWMGEYWGNPKAGYFVVAAFFGVSALVFFLVQKRSIAPALRDYLIRKVYALYQYVPGPDS